MNIWKLILQLNFTSFPPLALLAFSFFSSITRCRRSVSISCSAVNDGVDGAPILLFDSVTFGVDSTIFANGCGIVTEDNDEDGSLLVGWLLICCSAAFISSTVTLCVDLRSRLAWAERCLRCASASSSRLGGTFERLFPPVESSSVFCAVPDVTVTFVVGVDCTGGRDVVTLTSVDGVTDVDSLTPAPDRRRTYGPVLFVVDGEPSPTVRSFVPHLDYKYILFIYTK